MHTVPGFNSPPEQAERGNVRFPPKADMRLNLAHGNDYTLTGVGMKRPILILSALVALGGCGQSPRCASNSAQGLVEALRPREQFRSMLTMTVKRTQTVGMAAARDGSAARQKLAQAVDEAVERHGAEWERNLVASWQTLSAAEVEQVCTALKERDQDTFMRFTQRVGPEVKSRNEPLLRRAGVEVLESVW